MDRGDDARRIDIEFEHRRKYTAIIRVRVSRSNLLQRKAKGRDLLDQVCEAINLIEKDYFGLVYSDRYDPRNWLELDKRIAKFMKSTSTRKHTSGFQFINLLLLDEPWKFSFEVKFYPPDPAQLQEDITR